jgi:hypothetical protein
MLQSIAEFALSVIPRNQPDCLLSSSESIKAARFGRERKGFFEQLRRIADHWLIVSGGGLYSAFFFEVCLAPNA